MLISNFGRLDKNASKIRKKQSIWLKEPPFIRDPFFNFDTAVLGVSLVIDVRGEETYVLESIVGRDDNRESLMFVGIFERGM